MWCPSTVQCPSTLQAARDVLLFCARPQRKHLGQSAPALPPAPPDKSHSIRSSHRPRLLQAAGLLLEPDCILRTHARRQLCCCTPTVACDGSGRSALRSHTLARARSGRSGQEPLHVQACCWRWCLWCTQRCGQAPTRRCSASRLMMGPLQSSRCWTTTLGGTM